MSYNPIEQKRNIDSFITNHSITEYYSIGFYFEQTERIHRKLNELLSLYNKTGNEKTKAYAKLLNQISEELQYLKASNEAMENIVEMQNSGLIQCIISGKILDLKREISITIEKAEKILKG